MRLLSLGALLPLAGGSVLVPFTYTSF